MKPVLYKTSSKGDYTEKGSFLQWGLEAVEAENSVCSYTVAIIQVEDGTITIVHPEWVKFI